MELFHRYINFEMLQSVSSFVDYLATYLVSVLNFSYGIYKTKRMFPKLNVRLLFSTIESRI